MYFSLLSLVTECQELTHDQFGLKIKLPTSEFDLLLFILLTVGRISVSNECMILTLMNKV